MITLLVLFNYLTNFAKIYKNISQHSLNPYKQKKLFIIKSRKIIPGKNLRYLEKSWNCQVIFSQDLCRHCCDCSFFKLYFDSTKPHDINRFILNFIHVIRDPKGNFSVLRLFQFIHFFVPPWYIFLRIFFFFRNSHRSRSKSKERHDRHRDDDHRRHNVRDNKGNYQFDY